MSLILILGQANSLERYEGEQGLAEKLEWKSKHK